jgi:cytochrome c553
VLITNPPVAALSRSETASWNCRRTTQPPLRGDPRSGFVAYVPKGSIAKGRTIVTGDGGRTTPCAACHGSDLTGMGKFPAISGHHPGYIARQLYFFQSGSRSGPNAELMHEIAQRFTNDDTVAIAAYLASLQPQWKADNTTLNQLAEELPECEVG